MDPKFQSSFIPKQSFKIPEVARPHRLFKVFPALATALFVLALLASVGVFIYARVLEREIAAVGAELSEAKKKINTSVLAELKSLDHRLRAAKAVLERHQTVAPIFAFLEENTLKSVRFTSFNFAADKDKVTINLLGQTGSFTSVALQADRFASETFLETPEFGGFSVSEKGEVSFSVNASVGKQSLLYRRAFEGNQ
ncbi:MAG: hypothetical protein HYT43_02570 [Candidatus Taylorbacteria bacterium]|nr:hypothetical protein [Candidatus Taylorbacteria bacterium]